MNILFVCSECSPFIKTGGLADVIGTLPTVLTHQNVNSSVILPYYKKIKNNNSFDFIGSTFFTFNNTQKYVGVFKTIINNTNYFFIDNEEFFYSDEIYSNDDGMKFTFFNMAVIETLGIINQFIDIIHINDWHAGLIPFLLKYKYNFDIKTVFTIHNIQYQGIFDLELCKCFNSFNNSLEFNGKLNFMKTAIMNSTVITTVSPTYKEETLTNEYGYGLEHVLALRKDDYYGIINGIDSSLFNPSSDKYIYYNYSYFDNKFHNKISFCEEFNLDSNLLCGFVSRLCEQKGIDIILDSIDELLQHTNINFFFVGSGDKHYEEKFIEYSLKYPNRIKTFIGYNEQLASKVYASSDILLVPSKFEPCGLTQMIAMKYGTLPVVRETGGLKDSVEPYNKYSNTGCGFSFKNYSSFDLKQAIYLANDLYRTSDWSTIASNAMKKDLSFNSSSKEYIKIYRKIRG